jgi:DNA polymerase III delta prime subunit
VSLTFVSRVNITPPGLTALLKLTKGDMRRALNVLQACHAAYDEIGETEIYTCTGQPHPKDIETVVRSMMGDDFGTSYQRQFFSDSECAWVLYAFVSNPSFEN